jgi:hypothetical protein
VEQLAWITWPVEGTFVEIAYNFGHIAVSELNPNWKIVWED